MNPRNIEIADEFREDPTFKKANEICKKYALTFGKFLRVIGNKKYAEDLRPFVDKLRAKNKLLAIERKELDREKNLLKSKNSKKNKVSGWWKIPEHKSRQVLLKPTEEQKKKLDNIMNIMWKFGIYSKEAHAKNIRYNYDVIKKFMKKNKELGSSDLLGVEYSFMPSLLASSIRGSGVPKHQITLLGSKARKMRDSNNSKIVFHDDKYWMQILSRKNDSEEMGDIEIVFNPEKNNGYYKELKEMFKDGWTPSSKIIKAKNGNYYQIFSLDREDKTKIINGYSNNLFIVVQPFISKEKFVYCTRYFNEDNQLLLKDTPLNLMKWWNRTINFDGKTKSNLLSRYVHKSLIRVFRKWRENWSHLRPIVILLPVRDEENYNKDLKNWNPEGRFGKFACVCKDKLAKVGGRGINLEDHNLYMEDIDCIRLRLSM